MTAQPLLEVQQLVTQFRTKQGYVTAVDGVSFKVRKGETLGIVGESGCGKSVTSLSILRLLPTGIGRIAGGKVLFNGEDLTQKSNKELSHIRGKDIAMIFQDSMTSLNPVLTVGRQIEETIAVHSDLPRSEIKKQALDILTKVGVSSPEQRLREYPHQLSGGMRQRVMIAMALSCNPSLLIADEPTTALDVTIQAQIIDLMVELKKKINAAIMLITHDMGVVAEMADSIMVMYAGQVVEYGTARQIFRNPLHPYTQGLLASIPRLDKDSERLYAIPGTVPSLNAMPSGCRFCVRCSCAMDVCREKNPPMFETPEGQQVRCWKYRDSFSEVAP
ncbi:MAG: ABC transporter ATP-binding protein [Aristaeellaceae bacterium]